MANNNYINNKILERELSILHDTYNDDVKRIMDEKKLNKKEAKKLAKGYISEELGEMFLKIAYNLINKNNFNNYTFREEMIGLGVEYLCRFAKNFDATNPKSNGFSYCTQICYNGFIQSITKENKRTQLKDKIIKESMLKSELDKWTQQEKGHIYEDDDLW
jgi:hypothetical protein